ncbi:MAG: M1 family metallopeptidase [Janthinobacterium lividum]
MRQFLVVFLCILAGCSSVLRAQLAMGSVPGTEATSSKSLVGSYGPYRSNNDLLHYRLNVRVDPSKRLLSGSNVVQFRMLQDGTRIQLELSEALTIQKVLFHGKEARFNREGQSFFVDTPTQMRRGHTYSVEVFYSGVPKETGRFGGVLFRKDEAGRPWIATSCEDDGARVWWPNKDQWQDEPQDGMDLLVEVPDGLTDISNGRLQGTQKLADGYTRWNWRVTYPINNYDVALNIGAYQHFSDRLGKLSLDFYALPESLQKAEEQFAQAKPMLAIFNKYFGEYPFLRDGYKLIEVPYTGMEHQSAVAYGNHFHNSYGPRDWTGVGISPRFDFIIIHESAHEWFGNSVSAADRADMWIQEGFTTYAEDVYVEARWGHDDAIRYINGLKPKVKNRYPIVGERGVNATPHDEDQYFKGALLLNTLRSVVADDTRWYAALHGLAEHFRYKNIRTEDVVLYLNQQLGHDYTPIFYEYLHHADLPQLQLEFDRAAGTVRYRWQASEPGFSMPVQAGDPQRWTLLHPTSEWQTVPGPPESFKVATDLYYVQVVRDGVAEPLLPPAPSAAVAPFAKP